MNRSGITFGFILDRCLQVVIGNGAIKLNLSLAWKPTRPCFEVRLVWFGLVFHAQIPRKEVNTDKS